MPRVDLTPRPVDFVLVQGETWRLGFTIRNKPVSPATIGTVVDLTGSAVTGTLKLVGVLTSSSTLPVTVTSVAPVAPAEHGFAKLTDEATAALSPGVYEWQLKWTDSLGDARVFSRGTIQLLPKA
jgi:hypothetical protein